MGNYFYFLMLFPLFNSFFLPPDRYFKPTHHDYAFVNTTFAKVSTTKFDCSIIEIR